MSRERPTKARKQEAEAMSSGLASSSVSEASTEPDREQREAPPRVRDRLRTA